MGKNSFISYDIRILRKNWFEQVEILSGIYKIVDVASSEFNNKLIEYDVW